MRLGSGVAFRRCYKRGGEVRRQRGEARASGCSPVLEEGKRRHSFAGYHTGSGA